MYKLTSFYPRRDIVIIEVVQSLVKSYEVFHWDGELSKVERLIVLDLSCLERTRMEYILIEKYKVLAALKVDAEIM